MIRIVVVCVLALCVSLVCWSILNSTYSHSSFASEEAQKSLEVTEQQTRELQASRLKSDMIAFGLFGTLLGGLCGAVCSATGTAAHRGLAGVLGLVLGLVAGVAGAWLGHFHDANMAFGGEPMTYWFVRWIALLLPIGLVAGIAAQAASRFSGADGVVGGVLGASLAAVIYCLASGSLTPIEGHAEIFPAHSTNRLLAYSVASICIAGLIAFQLGRQGKKVAPEPELDHDPSPLA